MNCIFCDIANNVVQKEKLYEDDEIFIIEDHRPDAKIHLLIIPKKHFENFLNKPEELCNIVSRSIWKLNKMAVELGIQEGYRIIINNGAIACQTVFHAHIHIQGGQQLKHVISNLDLLHDRNTKSNTDVMFSFGHKF